MSDTIPMYTIIKTTPGNVLFFLSPLDNPGLRKEIYLTDRHPRQAVPQNFALDVFYDSGVFSLYKSGKFTFDKNDEIKKVAIENGTYFETDYDKFVPAVATKEQDILRILKSGRRVDITSTIKQYGKEEVTAVAFSHRGELTDAVIHMLESKDLLGISFTIDNAD
jgi:hypothetical protein